MFERFVYDGVSSDEYGIVCVTFSPTALETVDSHTSELQTEKSVQGNVFHIISQEYSQPLSYTMQIINKNGEPITTIQERSIKKWLCKKNKYKLFCILSKRYADTWFYANIGNSKVLYVADTVGLEFEITTNAPFAFSDIRNKKWQMESNDIITDFYVDNDEELPIYPDLKITMNEAGTLTLINESIIDASNTLTIENCEKEEIITMECGYPYITSSIVTHNVFNDFNKFWPYLIDGYNKIKVDKACTLEFSYREFRKVGLI